MSPVSYYSAASRWDLSPGYQNYKNLYLTRPINEPCWACHSSRPRRIAGTVNQYQETPFEEAGVGCEQCHGAGAVHAATSRPRDIVNPAKLSGTKRSDACAQCHLTGAARIVRSGRDARAFQPGDDLADFVSVFVESETAGLPRSTGHFERLAASACSIKSQSRLWCGSCHVVHAPPAAGEATGEKNAYYRTKCLGCHTPVACRAERNARLAAKDFCTTCHMPKTAVADVPHTAYTDHWIRARPVPAPAAASQSKLVPFSSRSTPRDLAMAQAEIAFQREDVPLATQAFQALRGMEASLGADAAASAVLGRLYDLQGNREKARALFRRAFSLDPSQAEAGVNLGAILFEEAKTKEAIELWRQALRAQSGLEAARLNIARALASLGQRAEARKELLQLLEFSPDHPLALRELEALK